MSYNHADLASCGYWGVLSYAQVWLTTDAPILGELDELGGKFDEKSMSAALRAYSVRRGFPPLDDDLAATGSSTTPSFAEIVAFVNDRLSSPPAALEGRGKFCQQIAEDLKCLLERGGKKFGIQFSAVTKLSWMLSPGGWTIYDSLANEGFGSPGKDHFYSKLDGIGFVEITAKLRSITKDSDWPMLWPERIVDSILLNRGVAGFHDEFSLSGRRAAQLRGLVSGLPKVAGRSLVELANEVQAMLDSDGKGERLA